MTSKHTAGPWEPNQHYITAGIITICDLRGCGFLTDSGGLSLPDEQAIEIQKANAHLIAASPDLLAACRAVIEADRNGMTAVAAHEAIAMCKAAVAKVEGA